MKKVAKNEAVNTTTTNNKIESEVKEVMETAKVEVKPEAKKRVHHTFKSLIMERITKRAKGLPDYVIDPIMDTIGSALNELQNVLEEEKTKSRKQKVISRRLSKFTLEDIQEYMERMKLN